jgi:hypothetical protein
MVQLNGSPGRLFGTDTHRAWTIASVATAMTSQAKACLWAGARPKLHTTRTVSRSPGWPRPFRDDGGIWVSRRVRGGPPMRLPPL